MQISIDSCITSSNYIAKICAEIFNLKAYVKSIKTLIESFLTSIEIYFKKRLNYSAM